jgi:hypothetical protein
MPRTGAGVGASGCQAKGVAELALPSLSSLPLLAPFAAPSARAALATDAVLEIGQRETRAADVTTTFSKFTDLRCNGSHAFSFNSRLKPWRMRTHNHRLAS